MRHGVLIVIAVVSLMSNAVFAASVETLVMPGPVISAHAKIESDCSQCHARLGKTPQAQLCMACHKKVAHDVSTTTGFHGRMPNAQTMECKSCHTEHKGRSADIVRLDRETFDHSATDFALRGAHGRLTCDRCHLPNKAFRDAPTQCNGCHAKDDAHKGRLGKDCGSCHQPQSWRKTRFDHSKTHYPLVGKHRSVDCNSCHLEQRYKGTPTDCYACHVVDDVHAGRLGPKCASCHSPKGWKTTRFDHNRDTHFPLRNKHGELACQSCHHGNPRAEKLKTDCYSCHRNDDQHKGQFGKRCDTCHSDKGWSEVQFDHAKQTKFALLGKHQQVACVACHRGPLYTDKLKTDCIACHRADDAHQGQEGTNCGQCHTPSGWSQKLFFDHGLTRFPLVGQHAVTPCEECHASARFKKTPMQCDACHEDDDKHKKTLGTDCEQCHNPNGWRLWRFDHNRQTRFVLDGAHEGLRCDACHSKPTDGKVHLTTTCGTCHQQEDVHRGRFGPFCGNCHNTENFDQVNLQR